MLSIPLLWGVLACSANVLAFPSAVERSAAPADPVHDSRELARRDETYTVENLNFVEPKTSDPPDGLGAWAPCPGTDECSCLTIRGEVQYFCGWVDPSWERGLPIGRKGRVIDAAQNPAESGAKSKVAADPEGLVPPKLNDTQMLQVINTTGDNGSLSLSINVDPITVPKDIAEKFSDGVLGDWFYKDVGADTDAQVVKPGMWDSNDTNATTDAHSRMLMRRDQTERNLRMRNPLIAILKMIGFSAKAVMNGDLRPVLTKLPKTEAGKFVQGIQGTLNKRLSFDEPKDNPRDKLISWVFDKGTKFVLRWDYSGQDPRGDFYGIHVNLDLDDGKQRRKFGFYADLVNTLRTDYHGGVDMYAAVRERLTSKAQYTWQAIDSNPIWTTSPGEAAVAIAKYWEWLWTGNEEL